MNFTHVAFVACLGVTHLMQSTIRWGFRDSNHSKDETCHYVHTLQYHTANIKLYTWHTMAAYTVWEVLGVSIPCRSCKVEGGGNTNQLISAAPLDWGWDPWMLGLMQEGIKYRSLNIWAEMMDNCGVDVEMSTWRWIIYAELSMPFDPVQAWVLDMFRPRAQSIFLPTRSSVSRFCLLATSIALEVHGLWANQLIQFQECESWRGPALGCRWGSGDVDTYLSL